MGQKQNPKSTATIAVRLWTKPQALKAIPYLRSVVGSLRAHWLEVQQARLHADRLEARPGHLGRRGLFLREQIAWEADWAQKRFEEAVGELAALEVHSIDPARGFVEIPFAQGTELAWFVFDLFDPNGLTAWRFDTDSPEIRRPFGENSDAALLPRLRAADVDVLMSRAAQATNDWRATPGTTQP